MSHNNPEAITEKVAEFRKIFADENVWKSDDEDTAYVAIGNIETWITNALVEVYEQGITYEKQKTLMLFQELRREVSQLIYNTKYPMPPQGLMPGADSSLTPPNT